jgi:hypothetical protein
LCAIYRDGRTTTQQFPHHTNRHHLYRLIPTKRPLALHKIRAHTRILGNKQFNKLANVRTTLHKPLKKLKLKKIKNTLPHHPILEHWNSGRQYLYNKQESLAKQGSHNLLVHNKA